MNNSKLEDNILFARIVGVNPQDILNIGINYIFDLEERVLTNTLPFNPLKNEEHLRQMQDSNGGVQFSHTI
ncbi:MULTISPECIES: hypothetical protein [unclassified Eikenella]|uniref:hypothetical protein n=1 Tax=unclassified Eikenella TaxID=2639367 RepID=UPI000A64A58F|nr:MULTISPECIES: hypothetical protein [unclassified Eikenella]VDH01074.1 Uncharacterised protein [Helicobacter pametensis]